MSSDGSLAVDPGPMPRQNSAVRRAPLALDFRARAGAPWRALGWLALLTGLALCGVLADRIAAAAARHGEALERQTRLAEALRAAKPSPTGAPVDTRTLADIERANVVIERLTVPWDALFDAIEAADSRGLGLLALIPNARDRTVRLSGESRSIGEVLAYVDRLAAQSALSQVHLQSYATTLRGDLPVVSFTLAATWRQGP